ncbi:hypothetical protein TNCV_4110691 [Trichonephila clavipes]|nr:hypothetical protein TNCV_4110691 [Trichonephila clavipes]
MGDNPSGLILVFSSREKTPKRCGVLTALVPRKRQPWPKCPQSHFPLDLCERESTADEFYVMWKVFLT